MEVEPCIGTNDSGLRGTSLIKLRVFARSCGPRHFKKRVHMDEQEAQYDNRFLKGRQILHMIHDYFKDSGTSGAPLDFNDLPRVELKNDNMQVFDTNWTP